jgi:hypothetical protein
MAGGCCEFVDSRLRRSPPDRASAVPCGQAGKTPSRFPRLVHRSAAAHKLHSTTATTRIDSNSGKGETISRIPALAYSPRKLSRRPEPPQTIPGIRPIYRLPDCRHHCKPSCFQVRSGVSGMDRVSAPAALQWQAKARARLQAGRQVSRRLLTIGASSVMRSIDDTVPQLTSVAAVSALALNGTAPILDSKGERPPDHPTPDNATRIRVIRSL